MDNQLSTLNDSTKPLDSYFRAVCSIVEVASQLIEYVTPEDTLAKLDLSTLELATDTHMDDQLRVSLTDLVYFCKTKDGTPARVCFLFEHKSNHPGRKIYPQVGRYLCCAQENDIKQGREHFTVTIPVFFYHGEESWTPKPILSLYGKIPIEIVGYVPNFTFLVVNIQQKSREEILAMQNHLLLRNIFLAMKRAWDDDFFRTHPQEVVIFADENVREEVLMMLFDITLHFIQRMSNLNKKEIMEIAAQLPPTYEKRAKTTYEYLIEEGMEKGMEKGMELAIQSYMQKFPQSSNEEVSAIFDLKIDLVQKIRAALKDNPKPSQAQ